MDRLEAGEIAHQHARRRDCHEATADHHGSLDLRLVRIAVARGVGDTALHRGATLHLEDDRTALLARCFRRVVALERDGPGAPVRIDGEDERPVSGEYRNVWWSHSTGVP